MPVKRKQKLLLVWVAKEPSSSGRGPHVTCIPQVKNTRIPKVQNLYCVCNACRLSSISSLLSLLYLYLLISSLLSLLPFRRHSFSLFSLFSLLSSPKHTQDFVWHRALSLQDNLDISASNTRRNYQTLHLLIFTATVVLIQFFGFDHNNGRLQLFLHNSYASIDSIHRSIAIDVYQYNARPH
jgi:hypothetical protein